LCQDADAAGETDGQGIEVRAVATTEGESFCVRFAAGLTRGVGQALALRTEGGVAMF